MRTRDVAVALCLLAGPGFAAGEIQFSESDIQDLVVFPESVSSLSNPWRPEDHGRCH